jgi:hypothetical protein
VTSTLGIQLVSTQSPHAGRNMSRTHAAGRLGMLGFCGALFRTRTGDPLLTMRSFRQLIATHGNGFGLSRPLRRSVDLRLIATGCNDGAS